ncbi:MAG: aldo/keto reductase [Tepidisphaeraceae bacterium]
MNQRTLGRTGIKVSELGFGAAPAAYLNPDAADAAAMLNHLLDSGLNLIDTAVSYPGSHAFIGRHLSHRRGEFTLVSKVPAKVDGADDRDWSPAVVTAAVDQSLVDLKTDHIDVMLLHTCPIEVLQQGDAIAALAKARDAGKIRFTGFSGDNDAVTYAAGLPDVAVVETSINIVDQVNIAGLLPVAKKNNVGVIVKRPVANACWKNPDDQPGMYRGYSANYTERLKKMNIKPADLGFSGEPNDAWPEIALRFVLSFPEVSSLLVGTTKRLNAENNIAAVNAGPLPADAVKKLCDAFKEAATGDWKGLT